MMPIRVLPEARIEMLEASDFYDEQREGLGDRFIEDVDQAVAALREAPKRCPQIYRSYRRCQLHIFPYGIFYRITKTEIVIVAISHLHRRPGYWRKRWRG
jgi:hypothetical protein